MEALAIDFEKANEDAFSVCAIGLAWVENGEVTKRVSRLIKPREMRFGFHQSRCHGIKQEDVANSAEFPEVIREFLPDISGSLLLAHNASVDVEVLCSTLKSYKEPIPNCSYLCTLQIAKRCWPNERAYDLGALAQRLGFQFRHHDAGDDAFACAKVALAAAKEAGIAKIVDLARLLHLRPEKIDAAKYALHKGSYALQSSSERLQFVVRGSTGNRYEIIATMHGAEFVVRCSCPAGQNNKNCRHVDALLQGDISNLLSNNVLDVEVLKRMVARYGRAFSLRRT